jgi:hypothetical protein
MTKLKVDLKNGLLEVEGEETFVRSVYADYKDVLAAASARQIVVPITNPDSVVARTKIVGDVIGKEGLPKTRSKNSRKESYKIISDLILNPTNGTPSLKAFLKEKNPSTAMEVNAVVIYYLQKKIGLSGISPDHVYTCYKNIERKVPAALVQSLFDTASLKGWIDTKDKTDIRITTTGENLVEHDLPPAKSNDSQN